MRAFSCGSTSLMCPKCEATLRHVVLTGIVGTVSLCGHYRREYSHWQSDRNIHSRCATLLYHNGSRLCCRLIRSVSKAFGAVVAAAEAAGLVGTATPPAMVQQLLSQRVEEDGKNLSGGIGKAIAFARVFVKPTADLGSIPHCVNASD